MGDMFAIHFFGKAPMTMQLGGYLLEIPGRDSKAMFMELYTKLFRISKVAKYKIIPILQLTGLMVQGAFLSVSFQESSSMQDAIPINMEFLVFNMYGHQALSTTTDSGTTTDARVNAVSVLFNEASQLEDKDISDISSWHG